MHYWISWEQPGDDIRPLTFPPNLSILGWWETGVTADGANLVALVQAKSTKLARSAVRLDWPEVAKWRFCDTKPDDWRPSDRFPLKGWMKERLAPTEPPPSNWCLKCGDSFVAGDRIALRSLGNTDYCCGCWEKIQSPTCKTCLYFRQWPHMLGTDDGCCRINAITYYGFPPTTKDNWCGEWKEKP